MLAGLQTKLIILAVAAVMAFGAGWKTRDAFCDATAQRKLVSDLMKQLEARDEASDRDAARIRQDSVAIEELEKRIADAKANVGSGQCLDPRDTDGLRRLWGKSKDHPRSNSR